MQPLHLFASVLVLATVHVDEHCGIGHLLYLIVSRELSAITGGLHAYLRRVQLWAGYHSDVLRCPQPPICAEVVR